jgi:hypothetical protein
MRSLYFLAGILAVTAAASAQTTVPVSPNVKVKAITSADKGPDIDPVRLAAGPYTGTPMFQTLRSFMSANYAFANVWIYAAGDDPKLYDTKVSYPFPHYYKPTWGEVFDVIARQTRCKWSWNPDNRQFKFEPTTDAPFFGVTLADGWQTEDRGEYIWFAPKDQDFGMDIYYFGHYTPGKDADLLKKVRTDIALRSVAEWPNAPTEQMMTTVQVAGTEALLLKTDTPRPGGRWFQWSLIKDGHAFLIVSAMPKEKEAELLPAVEKMVASFKIQSPTTRPATR